MVGESVTENNTVENIEALFEAAKKSGLEVFISPHYYYRTDHGWKFEGTLEKAMHDIHMFDRPDPLSPDGFEGSGADWLERYRKYIQDGKTVVASPHKVYGPESNDLVLQLRKRSIDRVILGGMSANQGSRSSDHAIGVNLCRCLKTWRTVVWHDFPVGRGNVGTNTVTA